MLPSMHAMSMALTWFRGWYQILPRVVHGRIGLSVLSRPSGMPRNRHYHIPVPTWSYPHCGYVHSQGTVVRIDRHRFRCNGCGRLFPVVSNPSKRRHPEGGVAA
jgi:hypothetical protein